MNILDFSRLIQFREVWDAQQELAKLGYSLRIVNQDDKACVEICDVRTGRVNVAVTDGRIHNVLSIG